MSDAQQCANASAGVRAFIVTLAAGAVLAISAVASGQDAQTQPQSRPAKVRITVSKETTWLTKPLNDDGTVNYLAALNARMSKGVTPQNNAAVLLVEVFGKPGLPDKHYAPALKIIGAKEPTGDGLLTYTIYEALEKAMDKPWKPTDYPELAAWLKENDKTLDILVSASNRPRYYWPLVCDRTPPVMYDSSYLMPMSARLRGQAKAIVARAMLKAGQHDLAGAQADLLAVRRLGRLMAQRPLLMDALVAAGMEGLADIGDMALLKSGLLSREQALSNLAAIDKLGPVDYACQGEREFTLDILMMFLRARDFGQLVAQVRNYESQMKDPFAQPPEGVKPEDLAAWRIEQLINPPSDKTVPMADKPLHELIDLDGLLRAANAACETQLKTVADAKPGRVGQAIDVMYEKMIADAKKLGLSPQEGGEKLLIAVAQMDSAKRQKAAEIVVTLWVAQPFTLMGSRMTEPADVLAARDMEHHIVRVGYALAAYRADKGQYPEKLDVLAPAYIKELPTDIFTDKPLVYRPTKDPKAGYMLYSVGPDGKDDGGKERDFQQDQPWDIVLPVGADK